MADSNYNASNIILKLPLYRFKYLQRDFEDNDGLPMDRFISTIIEHGKFSSKEEIESLLMVMIDFFRDVDINGDNIMDWQEFSYFIIKDIEKQRQSRHERFYHIGDMTIQKPPVQFVVSHSLIVQELRRLFVAVGDEVMIYSLKENTPNLLSQSFKRIKIQHMTSTDRFNAVTGIDPKLVQVGSKQHSSAFIDSSKPLSSNATILYILFIKSLSVLCLLRSDNCLECYKLIVMSSHSESLEKLGILHLGDTFSVIAARDVPKFEVELCAVGLDNNIYRWNLNLVMSVNGVDRDILLSPRLPMLQKHTDFVLDLLTISNDSYRLLISCGLDKKVYLWDLTTMQFRNHRSYTSGLTCLGFDNKSVMFAGACDNSIVAWGLDSHIDAPLFRLVGHNFPILKVIGVDHIDSAFSLDSEGNICYWDLNKMHVQNRLLGTLVGNALERFNCLEVFRDVSTKYKNVAMVTHGKQQHILGLQDITPIESPPIAAFLSSALLLMLTVHAKNIIQWHAVTGKQIRSVNYENRLSEISCAVMVDGERKFIVGDSGGNVVMYSCNSIQRLRSFAKFHMPISMLHFVRDQNLIVVINPGRLVVLDTSLNITRDNDSDFVLREADTGTENIVSLAFSEANNIIATTESNGLLKLRNYCSLIPEMVINISSLLSTGEMSHVVFLDPYPLLIMPDFDGTFFLFPVGAGALKFGKKLWRFASIVFNVGVQSPGKRVREGRRGAVQNSEPEKEFQNVLVSFYERKQHLNSIRGINSVTVLQTPRPPIDSSENKPQSFMSPFENDRKITIFCGHDDGRISAFDITAILAELNLRSLKPNEYESLRPAYEPKTRLQRALYDNNYRRCVWSETEIQKSIAYLKAGAVLENCWEAHHGNVNSLKFIGDKKFLLSASEDQCVVAWSENGDNIGVLTMGRELDSIMRSTWVCPVDLVARNVERVREAREFLNILDLTPISPAMYMAKQKVKFPYMFANSNDYDDTFCEENVLPFDESMLDEQLNLRLDMLKQLSSGLSIDDEGTVAPRYENSEDRFDTDDIESAKGAKELDKKYYDSVSIDATKLFCSSVLPPTSPVRASSPSQTGFGSAMGSSILNASAFKFNVAELKKSKINMKLAMEASARRLYPCLVGERQRSGMKLRTNSMLENARRIASSADLQDMNANPQKSLVKLPILKKVSAYKK